MKRLPALLALVVVLVLVLMLGAAGMASADTITFDDDFNSTDPVPLYLPPEDSPIESVTWMAWDGSDWSGGHLRSTNFVYDSVISFTNPTYVNSFKLNGMPNVEFALDASNFVVFGPLDIVALDSNGNEVWHTTVTNLSEYYELSDEANWLTVEVNAANVSSIIFRAPNPIDWGTYPETGNDPNGPLFYASIDNLVINEAPIPASVWLMVSGLVGLVGLRRKFTC